MELKKKRFEKKRRCYSVKDGKGENENITGI